MVEISALCVYCGSRAGDDARHTMLARELGTALAARGITLVYGAGGIGLMNVVADAALAGGGKVVGVIPTHLSRLEVQHKGLSEIILVDSMHARKQKMFERADAFAVLPGGLGTLDELFEILTWRQIGLHDKPVFLLDGTGYWDPLLRLIGHVVERDFAPPSAHALIDVAETVEGLFSALAAAPTPAPSAPVERM